MMSSAVTSAGASERDIRNRSAWPGCRIDTWPAASNTPWSARMRLAAARSSSTARSTTPPESGTATSTASGRIPDVQGTFCHQADLKVGLYVHQRGVIDTVRRGRPSGGLERVRRMDRHAWVDSPRPIEGVSQGPAVQEAGVHRQSLRDDGSAHHRRHAGATIPAASRRHGASSRIR